MDSLAEKQREEERLRKEMEGEELKNFRQCVSRVVYLRFIARVRIVAGADT